MVGCTNSRIRSIAVPTAFALTTCCSAAELISPVISFNRVVARTIFEEPSDCFMGRGVPTYNLLTAFHLDSSNH